MWTPSLILSLISLALVLVLASASYEYQPPSSPNVVETFLNCLPIHSHSISNLIFTPQNTSFFTVLQSNNRNLRFVTPQTAKPSVIITPLDAAQVQAIVLCAKPLSLQIRVRSSGHDYEGFSSTSTAPNFILLEMFNFRKVQISKEDGYVAWVDSGAIVGELYHAIAKFSPNLAFPGGVCPTMATGGHFSGGGYGNLMRKFGLSVDNIVDALFVDASGKVLDRKSMGEDLFWAIRGGGAASFGIVLSWKIKLVSIPATVTVFNKQIRIEEGAINATHRWQIVAPKLPTDLFVRAMHNVVASTKKEGEYTVQVSFVGLFLGTPKSLIPLISKKFPELGLKESDCDEMSWAESALFWYNSPKGSTVETLLVRPQNASIFFKSGSDYVKKPISKAGISSIWRSMVGFENTNLVMQWNPYGGRMWEVAESATPFPHRAGNLFLIQYPLAWTEEGTESTDFYINMWRSFYKFMTPFVSSSPRESFLNYRDVGIGANLNGETNSEVAEEYGRKYFKGNFDRLKKVKTAVDPDNFFRNEQSIPLLSK